MKFVDSSQKKILQMANITCLKEGEIKILMPFWKISRKHAYLESLVPTHKNGEIISRVARRENFAMVWKMAHRAKGDMGGLVQNVCMRISTAWKL